MPFQLHTQGSEKFSAYELAGNLAALSTLTCLGLDAGPLPKLLQGHTARLEAVLAGLSQLRRLRLAGCCSTWQRQSGLLPAIVGLAGLQELDLAGNEVSFGEAMVEDLFTRLAELIALHSLCLPAHNSWGRKCKAAFAAVRAELHLTHLQLRWTLPNDFQAALALASWPVLRDLRLANTRATHAHGPQPIHPALIAALQDLQSLTHLALRDHLIGAPQALVLCDALQALTIEKCKIWGDKTLLGGMAYAPAISSLSIGASCDSSDQTFDEQELSHLLETLTGLRQLRIHGIELRNASVPDLTAALAGMPALRELHIQRRAVYAVESDSSDDSRVALDRDDNVDVLLLQCACQCSCLSKLVLQTSERVRSLEDLRWLQSLPEMAPLRSVGCEVEL
jgi:hypothetical protein